jgi:hypothetical protein
VNTNRSFDPDMAVARGFNLDIAATFGDVVAKHVTARMLPFAGPTYEDLVEQHRRWMEGETVTPTAMHIGKIVMGDAMRTALIESSSYGTYRTFHEGDHIDVGFVPAEREYGDTYGTHLFHELVRIIASVDTCNRGLTDFYTGNHVTYGGKLMATDGSMLTHVDHFKRNEVILRYFATLGDPTGFNIDPLSKRDVDNQGNVIESRVGESLLAYPAGVISVTLATEQSPHYRSKAIGKSRLSTTLSNSRSEIEVF